MVYKAVCDTGARLSSHVLWLSHGIPPQALSLSNSFLSNQNQPRYRSFLDFLKGQIHPFPSFHVHFRDT